MEPNWGERLRADAVEGSSTRMAEQIYGGMAISISLQVDRGTVPSGETVSLFPLDASIHPDAVRVQAADQIRVTGLWRRADNSVVATKRTIIRAVGSAPIITVDPEMA